MGLDQARQQGGVGQVNHADVGRCIDCVRRPDFLDVLPVHEDHPAFMSLIRNAVEDVRLEKDIRILAGSEAGQAGKKHDGTQETQHGFSSARPDSLFYQRRRARGKQPGVDQASINRLAIAAGA